MKHEAKSKESGLELISSQEGWEHPESGSPKMGPTVPLGDNSGVPKHASWLRLHVTACGTSDALQEIHDQQIKDDSSPVPVTLEKLVVLPFEKNTGKRNLRGPGVASRLQLCRIASTAHPPVCTSRRENAFVTSGCFNIYSAVSERCCAEISQMFVSLFTGFFWRRRAQCELIQIDWRVAAISRPPSHFFFCPTDYCQPPTRLHFWPEVLCLEW